MLLVHGGGFRFFSKDSHALVAARLCELGFLVVTPDYRLSPRHPFPSGLVDVLSVYDWVMSDIAGLGGDPSRVAVAGESAGANFALGVCLVASGLAVPPAPFEGRDVRGWAVPGQVVVHCGYLQASNAARFDEVKDLSAVVKRRTHQIQHNYLPASVGVTGKDWLLADPLCLVEGLGALPETFPQVLVPVGANDPVLDDSTRLAAALERLGRPGTLRVYPKAPHALYALPFHAQYERCWADLAGFLSTQGADPTTLVTGSHRD
jgi:acetyl esterase